MQKFIFFTRAILRKGDISLHILLSSLYPINNIRQLWLKSLTQKKVERNAEYSSRNVYLLMPQQRKVPHYTLRTGRNGMLRVYTQLRFSSILHGNSTRFAWRRPRRRGLFSLTFYESNATDAAINLAERLSIFEHSNNSITIPPRFPLPRSTLVSLLFTVTVTVTRQLSYPPQRRSSDARARGFASTMYP